MAEGWDKQWAALPAGELHAEGRCAYCGMRGLEGVSLRRTVIVSTRAVGFVCVNVVRCERRRYRAKNI